MFQLVGYFSATDGDKPFHISARNLFEALKLLAYEAEKHMDSDKKICLPSPSIEHVQHNETECVDVVFTYSNALNENDVKHLWRNFLKVFLKGRIV